MAVRPATNPPNGKRHATQQSVNAAVWSICDIMRRGGATSALQYVPELTWVLFLRILDETDETSKPVVDRPGIRCRKAVAPHPPGR
jgi:type I restriction enzyme M protein